MTYLKQLLVSLALACALASCLPSGAGRSTKNPVRSCSAPADDSNCNGIDDSVDIATGTSLDENLNNIPDEAEGN
ncbi:MAG: hypothetical protein ACI8QC_002087 [Planctomycetota bacterium]|jgi:hypothetical protein